MFNYHKKVSCVGLRYPKTFCFKNTNYLIGSKKYQQKNDITKYGIYLLELDDEFNIVTTGRFIELENYKYLDDVAKSAWVRDINIVDNKLFLNIEIKINNDNKNFYHDNLLVSTSNLTHFNIIKKYNTNNY